MKITVDMPDEYVAAVKKAADHSEYGNRSAVVRKALAFYLFGKPSKAKCGQLSKAKTKA